MILQKYYNDPNKDDSYVDLFELDVDIYCDAPKETETSCPVDQTVDLCQNRDLITDSEEKLK